VTYKVGKGNGQGEGKQLLKKRWTWIENKKEVEQERRWRKKKLQKKKLMEKRSGDEQGHISIGVQVLYFIWNSTLALWAANPGKAIRLARIGCFQGVEW
jgi:hypothetical protein